MALFRFDLLDTDLYTYDDNFITLYDGSAHLRRRDSSGNYTWPGKYTTSELETFDYEASGIDKFVSFQLVADIPTGTNISVQVSVDSGVTWRRFDGINWVSDGLFSTALEIAKGIKVIDFDVSQGKKIRFKLKFETNVGQSATPILYCVLVYSELNHSYFDDLKRSLRRFLVGSLSNTFTQYIKSTSTSNTFSFTPGYNIRSVTSAYNKNQDEHLINNILGSFSIGANVTVNLTQSIPVGEYLFIEYDGYPDVDISGKDELLFDASNPKIIIANGRSSEQKIFRNLGDEIDYDQDLEEYRFSQNQVYFNSGLDLLVVDTSEKISLDLSDSLFEILQYGFHFRSLATGEKFIILDLTPIVINDITKDGIRIKRYILRVGGSKVINKFKIVPSVKNVIISLGDFISKIEEVTI